MSKKRVFKATEILAGEINILSAVTSPAIQKQWLLKKSKEGKKQAELYVTAKIIKSNDYIEQCIADITIPEGHHIVVGAAYKAMEEDAHGDFATENTCGQLMNSFIEKGEGSNINHAGDVVSDIQIVKNWQLEEDLITTNHAGEEETIKKGSWMAAAIVKAGDTWDKIEKNELNGWSMEGMGVYDEIEVDLEQLNILEKATAIVKGLFNDKMKARVGNKKIDAIDESKWIFNDVYWDMYDVGDAEGIIEATEEFLNHIKSLDDEGKSTIIKSLNKKIIKKTGGNTMSGLTKEDVQEMIKKSTDPLVEENKNLKEKLEKSEEKETTKAEETTKAKYVEFAKSKGFNIEADGDYTANELAREIVKGLNIDIEGESDDVVKGVMKSEMAKTGTTVSIKKEVGEKTQEWQTPSEIMGNKGGSK